MCTLPELIYLARHHYTALHLLPTMSRLQLAISSIFCLLLHGVLGQVIHPLRITTIASHNRYSVLECWQINSTPVEYMAALNYAIGGAAA